MRKQRHFFKLILKDKHKLYNLSLTYFTLISLCFIFFELSANNMLKNYNNVNNPLFTPVTLFINVLDVISFFIVLLCSLVLIEVYKGFLESYLKENTILRVCGFSTVYISSMYSLFFVGLVALITPLALLCGYILDCLIHYFLYQYLDIVGSIFIIDNYIFFGIGFLIVTIIIWVMLFTAGYFHKISILDLLNKVRGKKVEDLPLIRMSKKNYIFFFILGLIIIILSIFNNESPLGGIVLIILVLKKMNEILMEIYCKRISKNNYISVVATNECKAFLQRNNYLIFLFQFSLIMLAYLNIYLCIKLSDQIIGLLAFFISIVSLSGCLIYKYFLEISKSINVYKYCWLLGYSYQDITSIIKKTFNCIISIMYFIPTIIHVLLYFSKMLNNQAINIVLFIFLLDFIFCILVKLVVYYRSVVNVKEGRVYNE